MQALRRSNATRAFSSRSRVQSTRILKVRCQASDFPQPIVFNRRGLVQITAAALALSTFVRPQDVLAAPPQPSEEVERVLCNAECVQTLEGVAMVTTDSGLQYKDIVVGKGSSPPVGFQAVVHYVAYAPNGRVFENSLTKRPFDIRVGAGQVVAGLDEGLLSMKPGGIRRLYIPGPLSFPKGLKAAAGRPSVPPFSPITFDVQLLYIPGLEDDEE